MSAQVTRTKNPADEHPLVQAVMRPDAPSVGLTCWQGDQEISAVAALMSATTYALYASFSHTSTPLAKGLSTGPIASLVDELYRLLPQAGSPPRHPGPQAPLPCPDLLALCSFLREGNTAAVGHLVNELNLPDPPGWARDLADTTGGMRLTLRLPPGEATPLGSAMATTSGWVWLRISGDDAIHGSATTSEAIRERLLDACVLLATRAAA